MSIATAISKSSGKVKEKVEFTEEQKRDEEYKAILENQRQEWLMHPNTRIFIAFLGKRELKCLDLARNSVGIDQERTNQYLYRSKEIRKVIEYVTTGREESSANSE